MDILDQFLWAGLLVALFLRRFSRSRRYGGLVVEAIQVAASFLKLLDPFLRLCGNSLKVWLASDLLRGLWYLGNHHVAVECAFSIRMLWAVDMGANLRDDWWTEGDVWYKVSVHLNLRQ